MGQIKDLTGKVFGELTVESRLDERDKHGSVQWDCVCSCGNKRVVSTGELNRGLCTKCEACYKKAGYHSIYKNREKALFISLYKRSRYVAKQSLKMFCVW